MPMSPSPSPVPSLPSYSSGESNSGNGRISLTTEVIIATAEEEIGPITCEKDDDDDLIGDVSLEKERATMKTSLNDTPTNPNATAQHCISFSSIHSSLVSTLTTPLVSSVLFLSKTAATHPLLTITILPLISFLLLGVGFLTNFNQTSSTDIFTPVTSMALSHGEWIGSEESGFPNNGARVATLIVHANGKNVLGNDNDDISKAKEGLQHVFEALDTIRSIPGYGELCTNPVTNEVSCWTFGVSLFYDDDYSYFLQNSDSDEDVIKTLSSKKMPNGLDVDHDRIIGNNRFTDNQGDGTSDDDALLEYAESYVIFIGLPGEDYDEVMQFEAAMIDELFHLKDQWEEQSLPNSSYFTLELFTYRSFGDEFQRVIIVDLPLVVLSAILMTTLCILVFHKHGDKVHSRKWLGFGAVLTIFLSIMCSFGLLFCVGVPFTTLTPCIPTIIFGVGLDDTFIIFGSYLRIGYKDGSGNMGPAERVERTMKEVAPAIILTTLTSATAFALGLISSIPAIKYLVFYAFTSILVDFVFQVTFFIALLILDERRIKSNRLDCCFCCTAPSSSNDGAITSAESIGYDQKRHFSARVMASYGKWLLKRPVSIAVIVIFLGMFGVYAWSASQLTQYFEFTQVVPHDSYIHTWQDAWANLYSANGVPAGVYFRDVDFSDQEIQSQMKSYVRELSDSPYVGKYPEQFWLEDLETYVSTFGLQNFSFEEQLDQFLNIPAVNDLYSSEIIRDASGKVISSRTYIRLDNLVESTVQEKVEFLHAERDISSNQEVNKGLESEEWKFFTFSDRYYIFEFYSSCPQEFATSTIIGVVSVTALSLLFIPHWACAFITGVSIAMLNINLLGFMRFFGVMVSPMSYVCCIMSIGLMVDHVMHVTVRYMEIASNDRKQRMQETLETMGASILLGGISTLLGVLPLVGASNVSFYTVFIIFFGVVILGVMHALVFLPAVLMFIGPLGSVSRETDVELHKQSSMDGWSSHHCETGVESSKDDLSKPTESTAASPTDLAELDNYEEVNNEKRGMGLPFEERACPSATVTSTDNIRRVTDIQVIRRDSSCNDRYQVAEGSSHDDRDQTAAKESFHNGSNQSTERSIATRNGANILLALHQVSEGSSHDDRDQAAAKESFHDGGNQSAERSIATKNGADILLALHQVSEESSHDDRDQAEVKESFHDGGNQSAERSLATRNGANILLTQESFEIAPRDTIAGFVNSVGDLLCFMEKK